VQLAGAQLHLAGAGCELELSQSESVSGPKARIPDREPGTAGFGNPALEGLKAPGNDAVVDVEKGADGQGGEEHHRCRDTHQEAASHSG
jgi:hypothetical protein